MDDKINKIPREEIWEKKFREQKAIYKAVYGRGRSNVGFQGKKVKLN